MRSATRHETRSIFSDGSRSCRSLSRGEASRTCSKDQKVQTAHKPTQPREFVLASEVRAVLRSQFDEEMREKERRERVRREEDERLRARREAEDLRMNRRNLIFHASGVRQFSPVRIKKSLTKLTSPVSPKLRTSQRGKKQRHSNSPQQFRG
eukprot:TRINITY_DN17588_c0_g1_i1.p1 TRINITY_DN17588_c0_g1~~TRINITY_DN17588_c0_g1_i1.p1  ORF type:complete len:152 (+),score=12.97 TRINITY_DN17588_c0_g1_i1:320-775(+)